MASIIIAGTQSGVGKTTISIGVMAALKARGLGQAGDVSAARLANTKAYVAALLRCNVLGSNSWRRLWEEQPPTRLRPVRRPSFSGDGATDASEYLWMLWVASEPPINLRPI